MKQEKFYKVKFKTPPFEKRHKTDFYFGSLAAIYEMFTIEQIGCKVENLWNLKVSDGGVYENKQITITTEVLYRKTQMRPFKGDKK